MDELGLALRDAAKTAQQQAHPDFAAVVKRARRRRTRRVIASTAAAATVAVGIVALVLVVASGTGRSHPPVPAFSSAPAAPAHVVSGRLRQVGGPAGAGPVALQGVVTAHGPHGATVQVRTTRDGAFTVRLTPGRWRLSATSPQYFEGKHACVAAVVIPTTKPLTIDCAVK